MLRVTENYAPYAPPKNVLEFLRRKRDRGLPDVIGEAELRQVGIPQGNIARTLRALQFLGLIEKDGLQTTLLRTIGTGAASEYQAAMAEMIRSAYHSVFTIVDPEVDAEAAVADAFRRYRPAAQRSRMVALFLALCREAGIVKNRPRRTAGGRGEGAARLVAPHFTARSSGPDVLSSAGGLPVDYRLVSTLVQQLPQDAKWTKKKRGKWLQAVAAAVDLIVEVTDE